MHPSASPSSADASFRTKECKDFGLDLEPVAGGGDCVCLPLALKAVVEHAGLEHAPVFSGAQDVSDQTTQHVQDLVTAKKFDRLDRTVFPRLVGSRPRTGR
jgi:hypothetical protein